MSFKENKTELKYRYVESKMVQQVAYDTTDRTAHIVFNNGNEWKYPSSSEEFAEMLRSSSIGHYVASVYKPRVGEKVR